MAPLQDSKSGLATLDKSIWRATLGVAFVACAVPAAYFGWFYAQGHPLSRDTGDWGAFSDYMGGILGPTIALFVFYWLTRSIRLQKEELSETRAALAEASKAQQEQAAHQLLSNQLLALDSQLRAAQADVEQLLRQIEAYVRKGHSHVLGFAGTGVITTEEVQRLQPVLSAALAKRNGISDKIDALIATIPHAGA